jgi:hypothetical protein
VCPRPNFRNALDSSSVGALIDRRNNAFFAAQFMRTSTEERMHPSAAARTLHIGAVVLER